MAYEAIKGLVQYGPDIGPISKVDAVYARNQIPDVMKVDEYQEPTEDAVVGSLEDILKVLMDYTHETGTLEDDSIIRRDLFDTRLMNRLMPRLNEVVRGFWDHYKISPEEVTNQYYKLGQDSDYIHRYRIVKDMKWTTKTRYGTPDITANLSKPEEDPKAITTAKLAEQGGYLKCQLCMGNMGYTGRTNHPARGNYKIVPVTINGSQWGFQYSPYVYYNEHCIIFNGQYIPMKTDWTASRKLFGFIKQFPHHFLGSNTDLPIAGGSILSRDHFQDEHHTFATAGAAIEKHLTSKGFEDVEARVVFWLISVLRLRVKDANRLIELRDRVLQAWGAYTNEDALIFTQTDGEPHNTTTPVARKVQDMYELNLMLRSNITTDELPLGVYHPHQELHHIKEENIGLIEVVDLAALSSKLKTELAGLGQHTIGGRDIRSSGILEKHGDQMEEFFPKYKKKGIVVTSESVQDILQEEVRHVFVRVLEDAGAYKCDTKGRETFGKFLESVGFAEC